jgi:site-specific DNA recombinase
MKAVIYARYSSDMQREESIEAQLMENRKYAEKHGIIIVKEYIDEAASGQTDNREAFQQMMEDAKKKLFDVIIVHKVDRFARNRYDAAIYKSMLMKYGIKVVYSAQPIDDTPEGSLLEGILEAFAEYYSKNLATEVLKGQKQNAFKAQFNGGFAPLGYDIVNKQYVVNEKEAQIVKEIFDLYLQGYGYKKVAEILNSKGYKNKQGKPFVYNSIPSILTNEKYAGIYVFNKTQRKYHKGKRNLKRKKPEHEIIRVEGGVPAIVPKEIFEAVQREIRKRAPERGKPQTIREYLLSGLVYCSCGSKMSGYSQKRSKDSENYYFYYRCTKCQNSIRAEELEKKVIEFVKTNIFNNIDELVNQIEKYVTQKESDLPNELKYLQRELKETEQQINNIVDMVAKGVASMQLAKKLQELEAYAEGIKNRLAELQNSNKISTTEIKSWLILLKQKFEHDEDIKNILPIFIDRIVVAKDNIEILAGIKKNLSNANSSSVVPSAPILFAKSYQIDK